MKTIAAKFDSPMFPVNPATMPNAECRMPKELRKAKSEPNPLRPVPISDFGLRASFGFRISGFGVLPAPSRCAFTLIELLVIIAIMGVLAALLFPVVGAVKKHQYLNHAQAEMAKLETAIDNYKTAYGFYPPGPANLPAIGNPGSYINQLYYELSGTVQTTVDGQPGFQTLNGSAKITAANVTTAFGTGGFVNCTKPGSEESAVARNFLPDLKPNQLCNFTNVNTGINGVNLLVSSVGGPDANYQPLSLQDVNPWRYNSSNPVNNPGSYELWIQLVIGNQTNLICNWTKQVQVNAPLP
jgi:prepilin-type N-terminal cleavage/methylation domain-containing protein